MRLTDAVGQKNFKINVANPPQHMAVDRFKQQEALRWMSLEYV